MSTRLLRIVLWLLAGAAAAASAAEPGPVARYTLDAGAGAVLQDLSGNGHNGKLHVAAWQKSVRGGGLAFGRTGSYVDCGTGLGRRLTGDMTLVAWVKLVAAPFPDGTTNWTVLDCEEYTRSGFVVRVDGQTAKLYYRASNQGSTPGAFSKARLANGVFHHLAVSRRGNLVTLYVDGLPDTTFSAGPPGAPAQPLRISSPGQSLQGVVDDLAIYDRRLSTGEILGRYKAEAAAYGKDTTWFGKLRLEPLLYLDRHKATAALDLLGVLPLAPGAGVSVELGHPGQPALKSVPAGDVAKSGQQDFDFDLAGLPAGRYELRAVLRDAAGKTITQTTAGFRYPLAPVEVARPAETTLPPLPEPPKPRPPRVEVGPDGRLTVLTGGTWLPLDAEFSYPGGGFNVLGRSAAADNRCEADWRPAVERLGPAAFRVTAAGKHYALVRRIEVQPSRVVVEDTMTNRTGEPLGVLVRNRVGIPGGRLADRFVAGYPNSGGVAARPIKTNPTIFLAGGGEGLGLVALDDVFIVQSLATLAPDAATLHSDTFALDARASYTLEWAVYPTPTGDYYDFINQVRRDEGRNGTFDGPMGFVSRGPADRRSVPTPQDVALRNLKVVLIHCLSYAADDPGVSIEGIEFTEYPKERALLKAQFAAIHKAFPGVKVAFHVAHSLYATDRPDSVFPDSRVIDESGRQAVYTADPGSYFSRQRREQGWNWYIYYPTLENSFGRAMLRSVDVMMDELGADGPFLDGFMWAYGGQYTYDRWDGHTARIDPRTKTIARKMGSVLLLSQDALVAYCRKVRDKGGVVVANNSVITRTIGRERTILHDRECFAGPEVHLAPTPTALSLPSAIRSEADVYRDVLDKLAWGNLYVYYEEGRLTHPSVPARMYPITFQEIHSGYVKGTERLVTMHPGLYGWRGDGRLHYVYLYDCRGVQVPHGFLSTIDAAGTRTRLELGTDQCAVLKMIPLELKCTTAVNLHVARYDGRAIEIVASGSGPASLTVRGGEFPVKPGGEYVVRTGGHEKHVAADAAGVLPISLDLGDRVEIGVTAAP